MQRIDENTYIDDTLVTCAEYQLFIDEMREQGKYYQPDHWTSFQFPEGHAREPILGVRHADAVTFCEWLTRRNIGEWRYRLPAQKEAVDNPIAHPSLVRLGYWTTDTNEQVGFAWIDRVPGDARVINLAPNFASEINCVLEPALSEAHAHSFGRYIIESFERAHDLTLEIESALAPILTRSLAWDRASSLDLISSHAGELASALSVYGSVLPARDFVLHFLVDIAKLEGRIAGRSPAFEGIRLVKERIR